MGGAGSRRRGRPRPPSAVRFASVCTSCSSTAGRCCRPRAIPDLVDARRAISRRPGEDGRRDISSAPGVRRQLAAEIEAQFAAYRATGLPLDHVNAHHHFHLHPTIARPDARHRPALRHARGARALGTAGILDRIESAGATPPRLARRPVDRAAQGTASDGGALTAPDQVFGLAWSGAMTEQRIARRIASICRTGSPRSIRHPATSDSFAGAASGYRYREELAALTAPGIRTLLSRHRARKPAAFRTSQRP